MNLPSIRSALGWTLGLAVTTPTLAQDQLVDTPVKPSQTAPAENLRLGTIERLDPKLDALIAPGSAMQIIGDGYDWAEGPVWNRRDSSLLFSDIPPNVVNRWQDGMGPPRQFLKPSGYTGKTPRGGEPGSNGLLFDREGRLILCQHGDRRIARLESDGSFTTLADRYDGKRFNSPNDATYKSDGSLYFTDPPYGLEGLNKDPKKETPFNGVYRLKPDGSVTLLTREISFPNGIGLRSRRKDALCWRVGRCAAGGDGLPGARRMGPWATGESSSTLATTRISRGGGFDGLKVDGKGNVFATGPGGVLIISPEGTHLGTLKTGVATANVAFGGPGRVNLVHHRRPLSGEAHHNHQRAGVLNRCVINLGGPQRRLASSLAALAFMLGSCSETVEVSQAEPIAAADEGSWEFTYRDRPKVAGTKTQL